MNNNHNKKLMFFRIFCEDYRKSTTTHKNMSIEQNQQIESNGFVEENKEVEELHRVLKEMSDFFDNVEGSYDSFSRDELKNAIESANDTFYKLLTGVHIFDNKNRHLFNAPLKRVIVLNDILNSKINIEEEMTNDEKFEFLKEDKFHHGRIFLSLANMIVTSSLDALRNNVNFRELTKICWESYIKIVLKCEEKIDCLRTLGLNVDINNDLKEQPAFLTFSQRNITIDIINESSEIITKFADIFSKNIFHRIINEHTTLIDDMYKLKLLPES